jgi:hypothetical protein
MTLPYIARELKRALDRRLMIWRQATLMKCVRSALMQVVVLVTWTSSPSQANPTPTPAPFPTPIAGSRPQINPLGSLGPLSPEVGGLALALIPYRLPYTRGRAISIILHFVNKTGNFFTFDPKAIRWIVTGTTLVPHALDPQYDPFSEHPLDIRPGVSEAEIDIAHYVAVGTKGTYIVRASVFVREPKITLTSPPVRITTNQKPGARELQFRL